MRLTIQIAAAIVVLLVGIVATLWILDQFRQVILAADPGVASAVIAGLVAIVLALGTFLRERSRAIKETHREKKVAVYQRFIDMVFNQITSDVAGSKAPNYASREFLTNMIAFKKDMLVYGSPGTIKTFNEFVSLSGVGNATKTMDVVGRLFLEIRKDIGLSNFALTGDDLHRLYVKDFGKADTK